MARLIDTDALNKELQRRVGSPTDDKLYEVNLCIIDAPTIDAIPVDWLREKREVTMWQFAWVIDWLLSDWQKEQEAK